MLYQESLHFRQSALNSLWKSWHTWGTGCHSEAPGKALEVSPWESYETKGKVLHLGWDKHQYQEVDQSSLGEKDLEVLVGERLDLTQPLTAQKAKRVQGCTKSSSVETPSAVVHSVLRSPAQTGRGPVAEGADKGQNNNQRAGGCLMRNGW